MNKYKLYRLIIAFCIAFTLTESSRVFFQSNDTCNPDYSIEYVKKAITLSEYADEGNERIWLRLTNLSASKLYFEAAVGPQTTSFLRKERGAINIYHEVVNKLNCSAEDIAVPEFPLNYSRVDVYTLVTLRRGKSFLFSVPANLMLPGRAIYIKYKDSKSIGESMKAYFFCSQLPGNVCP